MDISVVIPCYNCSRSIGELCRLLIEELSLLTDDFEIILVHDCGKDDSWKIIKKIATDETRIVAINLLKNLGQHKATLCGISYSRGNIIFTMDDDLQHKPSEIGKIYSYFQEHPDIDAVFASFAEKKHNILRNFGSFIQRYIRNKLFPHAPDVKMSSFRAFRKNIAEELLKQRQSHPRIGLMLFTVTSNIANVEVEHGKRIYGRSNYSLRQLIELTFVPLINYSSIPLRLVSAVGFSVALFSLILAAYYLIGYLTGRITVAGFTTLIITILFSTGITLFSFGIIGEYLSRIIEQQSMSGNIPVREVIGKAGIEEKNT